MALELYQNQLTSLPPPPGVFAGLPGFTTLGLDFNPGASFTLTLRLVRTDRTPLGGAVAVEVAEGAPFDMAIRLSATGGGLSAGTATIGAGRTVGDSVGVTRQALAVTVRPGSAPAIPGGSGCGHPQCINGLRLVTDGLVELSAPAPFTDDPLRPGVTPVRAIHFRELRERIGGLREGTGLPPFRWTDPILTPGVTPVRRVHVEELRSALAETYAAAGRAAPAYTDAALPAGAVVRAAHITELRTAIGALE